MASIAPPGKTLSQQPPPNSPHQQSTVVASADAQPVTAFEWVSLARATWKWLIRPLWYICFKWPAVMMFRACHMDEEKRQRQRRQILERIRRENLERLNRFG